MIAPLDQVFGVVRVDGHQPARVPDEDQIAVAALLAGEEDLAFRRGEDRRSFGTREVESVVVLAVARPES